MPPRISVVTVVFNSQDLIRSTLESVVGQTYSNFEYIVVDGGSVDGTVEILNSYTHKIDILISEPDLGIYDAMNKSISISTGDWVIFMNAGDTFYSQKTLELVFLNHAWNPLAILYGTHYVVYELGKSRLVSPPSKLYFWKGSQFSHQACFIPVNYHKEQPYNLHYRISADYDFFLRARKNGVKFQQLNKPIANIIPGGISDTARLASISERAHSLDSKWLDLFYFPLLYIYNYAIPFIKRAIQPVLAGNSLRR